MAGDTENIKNIRELIQDCKTYLEMQKEYTKLELTEKLTVIFSAVVLIILLTLLTIVVLFYLSVSLALYLAPLVGGLIVSFAIIAGVIVLLMLVIYLLRKHIIVNPLVNFFAKIFS